MNTRLYLDGRNVKTGSLKIIVRKSGTTAMIALGIKLQKSEWDKVDCKVINRRDSGTLNARIAYEKQQVDAMLSAMEQLGETSDKTAREVVEAMNDKLHPEKPKQKKTDFEKIYNEFVESKKNRTKELYEATIKKIKDFDKNALELKNINIRWLHRFENHLKAQGLKPNSISIHMRNIRAIVNYAIDIDALKDYPFRKFKITNEKTRKRSLTIEQMRFIWHYKSDKEWEQRYIDMFKLIFGLIGINLVDLLHLTSKNIVRGRLEYKRAKTGALFSVKVESEVYDLLGRLEGKKWLLYPLDTYKDYRHYTYRLIYGLRGFCKREGLPNISSYWARHTWATIASELDISKETIAHALGHAQSSVTDIYIDYSQKKIDEANRKILDCLI